MFANLLRICAIVALPVGCILLARHLAGAGAAELDGKELRFLCTLQELDRGAGAETDCLAADWLWLLHRYAWIVLAAGLAPVLLFLGLAMTCGTSRRLNAAVFPALIPVSTVLVVVNVLMQGALLLLVMIAIYVAYIGNPPIGGLIAAGIGILGVAGTVVAGTAGVEVAPILPVRADAVTRKQAPDLWAHVEALAARLDAAPPDSILIGLEPNFWAVSGVVEQSGDGLKGRHRGRTLHLSLPLMRILSVNEFAAVVGHELGHFQGREAVYSADFLPVFRAIERAKLDLGEPDTGPKVRSPLAILLTVISRAPARALLGMLGASFRGNARRTGRLREIVADAAATEAGGEQALATALFKLPLYARLWDDVLADHAARIALGKPPTPGLAQHFDDLARLLVTPEAAAKLRTHALGASVAHPYDVHLPTSRRIKDIGLKPSSIGPEDLRVRESDGVAEALLPATLRDDLEAVLTMAENRAMRDEGRVPDQPVPVRKARVAPLYHAVYSVLAGLVRIAPDPALRFAAAVGIGNAEMTEFDRAVFAEYCRARRAGMPLDEAIEEIMDLAGTDGVVGLREMVETLYRGGQPLGPEDPAVHAWLRRNLSDLAGEQAAD